MKIFAIILILVLGFLTLLFALLAGYATGKDEGLSEASRALKEALTEIEEAQAKVESIISRLASRSEGTISDPDPVNVEENENH